MRNIYHQVEVDINEIRLYKGAHKLKDLRKPHFLKKNKKKT